MAALSAFSSMTLPEAVKRAGFDGQAAVLGELAQMIDVLDAMPWQPTTHGTFNRQLQASRLGSGKFSKVNTAIPSISSTTELVEEPVKLYEGESLVDERLLEGVEDAYSVRDSEDALNLEGAFQDWAYNLFYANDTTINADAFQSLAKRRNALGPYAFSGGGAGATNTSAWLLELSPQSFYLGYPKNSGTPGLRNEDRGLQRVSALDGTTGDMWAWSRLYRIYAALIVRNRRSIIRYANIQASGASNTFLVTDFVRYGKNELQKQGKNAFLFVNRAVKGQIEEQLYTDTKNGALTVQAIEGYGPVTFIAGIPLRMHEGIPLTETALV